MIILSTRIFLRHQARNQAGRAFLSSKAPHASDLTLEQKELKLEARRITLSFWRTCVRCIRLLREGNERDEAQFRQREKEQENQKGFSFEPPVERENELKSRAAYYLDWGGEMIHQDSDCLDSEIWLEESFDRYLRLILGGEEKRKWILQDYEFEDPYPSAFDFQRVQDFERRAKDLVNRSYTQRGWSKQPVETSIEDADEEWFEKVP